MEGCLKVSQGWRNQDEESAPQFLGEGESLIQRRKQQQLGVECSGWEGGCSWGEGKMKMSL